MATKKKSSSSNKSTNKVVKKATKKVAKAAKKNPKIIIIIVVVALALVALGVGGYFLFTYLFPKTSLKLNGSAKTYVALHGEYKEKGAIATYNGKDISNQIQTTIYDDKEQIVTGINTEVESDYYVEYKVDYQKMQKSIKRKLMVRDIVDMSVNFLELGNEYTGDATFIKAGEVDILIDAGSRNASAGTISSFIDKYCEDGVLEYVIATHAHQDHIAGFVGTKDVKGIFDRYQVETIIDFNLHNTTSNVYKDYVSKRDAEVKAGAVHYTALDCVKEQNGASKVFDIAPGVEMEILYQEFYEKQTSDENDYSVCTLFTHADNHYLFTGDLEAEGEKSLVANNELPQVQLFKGAHHGSYTANTDALLSVIKPENVCICCCAGSDEYTKNKDNMFPAQAAINRLGKYTEKIYVTTVVDEEKKYKSLNGNITFYSLKGKNDDYTITGSNNSTILKDTDWFKANRTWPGA